MSIRCWPVTLKAPLRKPARQMTMLNKFKLFPVFILLASSVVLYLAIPRFIASMYASYPEFILKRIDTQHFKLADDAYLDLYRSLKDANDWSDYSFQWRLLSDLQIIEYIARFDQLTEAERLSLLNQIKAAISHRLTLSPIDPKGWQQLAQIKQAEQPLSIEALEALEMSIFTQPVAPSLLISRISQLLAFKSVLNESARVRLARQIRLAWQFDRTGLVALIAKQRDDKAVFNHAFSNDPEQWQELEKLLENYFKQNQQP
jgi:hypothetical protein